ncbi:MAG: bifunctional molybdenum cofactor biosynthesis protein MoaC/MoaB [Fimbriimonadaceae bacterium]|nr:bifunctional molybdenum cofactor biosynthesis protein MoaC/MoaB [Fimbriimonadaceae bacterium]
MRDVSAKVSSLRTAVAAATLRASPATVAVVREGRAPKGDPLPVARTAAILAAKNTPNLVPYCHHVALDLVDVSFSFEMDAITARVRVVAVDRTGVEMEALTAAAVAALNLYDMLKPIDEAMRIEAVELLEKTGGKSAWVRQPFRAAIIVASDRSSSGTREDATGPTLASLLREEGANDVSLVVVPDDVGAIRAAVEGAAERADLLFVAGGTGVGPRDVTPEAILPMLERRLPGVEEHLRAYGQRRLPTAMLSRSVAGLYGETIVVALPGSPGAARDAIAALFPYLAHALDVLRGGGHE